MEHIYINGNDEVFVLFHGTGGNENNLLFLTGELNPHASIISFLGNVGVGKNRRFFKPLINNKVYKEDLEIRVNDFLNDWDNLKDKYENKKITFIGYSNGANFILGLLEKRPDIAHKTLLLHPSYLDWSFTNKPLVNKIVATAGASDLLAPAGNVVKLKKDFENIGYSNFEILLLDGGHEISDNELKKLKDHYDILI